MGEATKLRTVELSAGLRAHDYAHAIQTMEGCRRMRTFVTEGLAALHSQEVSATVPFEWDDDPVRAALELLQQLERFDADGKPAVLGRAEWREAQRLTRYKLVRREGIEPSTY